MVSFIKNSAGKIELVFNDFVVKKNVCNLKCKYCLSNEAPEWTNTEKNEILEYTECSELGIRLNKVLQEYHKTFDPRILRISGGELFLIKNIEDFIVSCNSQYEAVQIITNGCYVTEKKLKALLEIENCCIHFSLDGHTSELNRYRTDTLDVLNNILSNIDSAVNMGFYVEIGSVLTDANTKDYIEFVEYFKQRYVDKVKLYPFPIRGAIAKKMYAGDKDIHCFGHLIEKYEDYKGVLAPKAYLEDIYANLAVKRRAQRCLIPLVSTQLFDDGNLSACPNSWGVNTANIFHDVNVMEKVTNEKVYKLFLQNKPRLKSCFDCYTSMDIVNIYLNGKISDNELLQIPLYSGKRTHDLLAGIRDALMDG